MHCEELADNFHLVAMATRVINGLVIEAILKKVLIWNLPMMF